MKIALVHPFSWPEVRRGAERYLHDLSEYLVRQGHDVAVVTGTTERTSRRRAGRLTECRRHHIRVRGLSRFGCGPAETFGASALLALLRERADVIHAFTPSAAIAGRLSRRPTLYTVLGHPVAEQLPEAPVPRRLFVQAVRTATMTATLSGASQAALLSSLGVKGVVLPAGVSTERFPPDLRARAGPPRVLFCASLADPRKRAHLAIAALPIVRDRYPDARLAVSGEGDVSALLSDAGPAIDVLGVGEIDALPGWYRSATVTVLPAAHEAQGLALLESLACGTPVVCTPAGGMPEILADHGVGRVATTATPEAIAQAVITAIELARRPGTPARCVERARCWDWTDAVGPAHEAIYRELAHRERARR